MRVKTTLVFLILMLSFSPAHEAHSPSNQAQVEKKESLVTAAKWAYKLLQTPEQVLSFLNGKSFFDVRVTATSKTVVAFHVFYMPSANAEVARSWSLMKTGSLDQLIGFLNNKVKPPFCWQPRICAVVNKGITEHYVFYKSSSQPAPGSWQLQQIADAEVLKNLMNSKAGEQQPQKDAEAYWLQGQFHFIYQATAQKKGWSWTKKSPFDEVLKYLNGKPPYSAAHPNARIAACDEDGAPVFFVFHR